MPSYLYRCTVCGAEREQHVTWTKLPEILVGLAHPSPDTTGDLPPCVGALRRVYEPVRANLGYREAHHTQNERHLFTHKI